MIPRRNRELPFGRNSFLFSYKRRYNGNLCARSVQQAKAASSMMTCTLSALAAYFLSTTVLCARNVSPTAYFLPTAAKSMKKCRQKPSVSAGVLWRLSARRQTHIIFHAYFSAFSGNLQHRGVYCRIRPPKAFPSHVRWERTFHHRKEAAGWKLCCGSCGSSGRYRSWRS